MMKVDNDTTTPKRRESRNWLCSAELPMGGPEIAKPRKIGGFPPPSN
jgi:hypothetical protein